MEQQLFPARESLVSDTPAGDRKSINLYYSGFFGQYMVVESGDSMVGLRMWWLESEGLVRE
jgi:hypothetical protein